MTRDDRPVKVFPKIDYLEYYRNMTRIFDSGSRWYKVGKIGETSVLLYTEPSDLEDHKDLQWDVVNLKGVSKNFQDTLPYINKFFGTHFVIQTGEEPVDTKENIYTNK
ncbi:MAG: hypothetical protein HYW48_11675 [Deltaproteobacteria bacterium]|nr:hypothetical protein [Deltaproteobacteria bacterium]